MIGGHRLVDEIAGFALLLRFGELLLEIGDRAIGEFARFRVVALALRLGERVAGGVEVFLELLRDADLVLLGAPARGQRVGLLLKVGEFGLELLQAVLRGGVGFLFQRLLLDLELHDAAVEFVQVLGLGVDLHALPRPGLVDQVDRLVRQEAVGDVTVGQGRGGDDRRIGDADAVMRLVLLLQAAQDRDRVLDRRLGDEHRLEAARERRVLFDVLAVFVERGRADAVQLAARQGGLEQVRRVHGAFRLARADKGVHFVDEQDHAALGRDHLVQHRLQPLLELAAIFRAGDQRAHVERQQLLVAQRLGHVAVDDAQRQALDDRGLADAGLADQHRVVLGSARQHLDGAPDLFVAADDRIELAGARGLGEVAGVFLQCVVGVLGARRVRRAAFAEVVDRGVERLRRNAAIREDLPASAPFSIASATSRRSTVTNESPAFSAIFSALSKTRAVVGAM